MQSLSLNPTQSVDWTHHLSHLRPTLNYINCNSSLFYKLSTITYTKMAKDKQPERPRQAAPAFALWLLDIRWSHTYLLTHKVESSVPQERTRGLVVSGGPNSRHPFFHPTGQLTFHCCCGRSSSMAWAWCMLFQLLSAGRQPMRRVSVKATGWPWSKYTLGVPS